MSEIFVWIKYSTVEQIGREVFGKCFMSQDSPKYENNRIIYGNDEIGAPHSFYYFY